MSVFNPWTNTRKNRVKRSKAEEEVFMKEWPDKVKELEKSGQVLKMHKVDDKPTRDEVINWTPSQHQFCYSGLHW